MFSSLIFIYLWDPCCIIVNEIWKFAIKLYFVIVIKTSLLLVCNGPKDKVSRLNDLNHWRVYIATQFAQKAVDCRDNGR